MTEATTEHCIAADFAAGALPAAKVARLEALLQVRPRARLLHAQQGRRPRSREARGCASCRLHRRGRASPPPRLAA